MRQTSPFAMRTTHPSSLLAALAFGTAAGAQTASEPAAAQRAGPQKADDNGEVHLSTEDAVRLRAALQEGRSLAFRATTIHVLLQPDRTAQGTTVWTLPGNRQRQPCHRLESGVGLPP